MIRSKLVMGVVVAGLALAPAPYALADETSQGEAPEVVAPVATAEAEAVPSEVVQPITVPATDGAVLDVSNDAQVPQTQGGTASAVPEDDGAPVAEGSEGQPEVTSPEDEPASAGPQEPEDPPASPSTSGSDEDEPSAEVEVSAVVDASASGDPIEQRDSSGLADDAAASQSVQSESKVAENSTTSTQAASSGSGTTLTNVYRLYNPNSGEHFYTVSLDEATSVFSAGWRWEDAVYLESSSEGAPVYRVYNPNAGAHFYTVSSGERDHLVSLGWRYEGISWRASGSNRLFRLYNPNSPIGEHLYTASAEERASVIRAGWNDEGYAWAFVPGVQAISGRWVVSSAYGSQERYWVASDARLAKSRYVDPDEGTGYNVVAYATSSGAVVRNKTRVGKGVMFADNDGRLKTLSSKGWWNTSSLDGSSQWYYIDEVTTDSSGKGVLGAVTGWLTKSGNHCYAIPSQGYIARGTTLTIDNKVYVFNSDGVPDKYGYQNAAGYYRVSSNNVWLGHAGDPFSYVTPSRIGIDATRDQCVAAFIQRAREYLGTPYKWDYAREPGVGVDCVGLVIQCAYATGMDLGDINTYNHYYTGPNGYHSHDANNLWNSSRAQHVSLSARKPGDVISWSGHVAVYIGNDQIIEAYSPATGVRQTSIWNNGTPRGVIRLFQ